MLAHQLGSENVVLSHKGLCVMETRASQAPEQDAWDHTGLQEHVLTGAWLDERACLLWVRKDGKELNPATPGPSCPA